MKSIALLFAALLALTMVPAHAQTSRDDAAAIAQKASGGRVLAVDRSDRDGRKVWKVKVVTSKGEVQLLYIDIESGSLL